MCNLHISRSPSSLQEMTVVGRGGGNCWVIRTFLQRPVRYCQVDIPAVKLLKVWQGWGIHWLTFFFLNVVQDRVDGPHGLVHQLVQLEGGGPRVRTVLVQLIQLVLEVQQARPASVLRASRCPGAEAGLPVCGGEREEVVNPRLHTVPLRGQRVHLVPVDLLGRQVPGCCPHHHQEEEGEEEVVPAMTVSS